MSSYRRTERIRERMRVTGPDLFVGAKRVVNEALSAREGGK